MAGWPTYAKATVDELDWIEEIIICPSCGEEFKALFCEDGDPHRNSFVITTLVEDNAECPNCKKQITDDDVKEKSS